MKWQQSNDPIKSRPPNFFFLFEKVFHMQVGSNELHLLEYILGVTNTLSTFKNGYFYSSTFFVKKTVLLLRYCGRCSSRYFILMQYKLKTLQFIPNAPSNFLWEMSDARSRMIHSFESILFKGLIKPVGKPVNRFSLNDSFSSLQHALSRLKRFSLRVVTKSKNTKNAVSRRNAFA